MVSDSTPMHAELTESDNGEQRFSIFGTTQFTPSLTRQKISRQGAKTPRRILNTS